MSEENPISSYRELFDETGANYTFEIMSPTKAKATPETKEDGIFETLFLELNDLTQTLRIWSHLPIPGLDDNYHLRSLLLCNSVITGYLSLQELKPDSYTLVYSIDIPTDQDYQVDSEKFQNLFSHYESYYKGLVYKLLTKQEQEGSEASKSITNRRYKQGE